MNKQEIEHELVRVRAIETTIKNNIIELLEQLIEAEKPKLRHGDFGYTDDGYIRIAIKCREKNDLMQLGHISMPVDGYENKMNTVLGNIFEMMRDWGEDLEEFNVGGRHFKINPGDPESFLQIDEIWHKLGALIMTYKKKQSKT